MRITLPVLLLTITTACESQSVRPADLPLGTFAYDRTAPIDLTSTPAGRRPTGQMFQVRFASPRGGPASGYLFVPEGPGPFAGIVVQHGMPSRALDMAPLAWDLVERGAVVISIDAPWARRQGEVLTWTEADSADQVQLITDLQRAVDILLQRPEVDSARLAYVGVSYGGAMGSLFAGVERRLATYVLRVADGGLVAHFTGAEDPPAPPGLAREQWDRWLAAMRPIEPIRFIGNANAPVYFQSGELDRLVPPADARQLHSAAAEPKKVSWYSAGHGLNPAAQEDMFSWLGEKVGLK
jgi:dienelactone hydrolase